MPKAHAAVAEHRVVLPQAFGALLELGLVDLEFLPQRFELIRGVGHELMQRRVEQADDDRQAVQGFHGRLDVVLDEGEELVQGRFALLHGLAHDHLAQQEERFVGALAVEHVLGAEEADALGAEFHGLPGVLRRVGVGADLQHAHRRRRAS